MASQTQKVSNKIWRWLDEVVIGQNFCPFAKAPRRNEQIDILVYEKSTADDLSELVLQACEKLDNHENVETILLVCTDCLQDFNDYLDMLDTIQYSAQMQVYEGVYQLASFHPHYLFAEEAKEAISHYTNRAPYPIIHIIREDSITRALENYKQPEKIPQRNIEHANNLGIEFFKRYL